MKDTTSQTITHNEENPQQRSDQSDRRLKALSRIGQVVTSSLVLDEVLQRVINEAEALLEVDSIAILLREEHHLKFVAVSQATANQIMGVEIPDDVGIAGKVIQTGEAMMVNQEDQQPLIYRVLDDVTGYKTQSLLAVPLSLNQKVIGVIEAVDDQPGTFTQNDLDILNDIANWAVIAIANAQQVSAMQQRLKEIGALADIGRTLLGSLDLDQVLGKIVHLAEQLIPKAERAVIHLLNEQNRALEIAAATGFESLEGPFFPIRPGEGIAGRVLAEGKTINVRDTLNDPNYLPLGAKSAPRSLMVASIQGSSSLLGTISVRSSQPNAFTEDDENFLTNLGVQAALAITNARLFEAEQQSHHLAETLLNHEKATRAQLVQSEKLAALGRIVASVAHELNNPLQAIQNALYLVQLEEKLAPQTREDLQVALNETNRMADLISRLRDTYRPTFTSQLTKVDINAEVMNVERLLATHARHQKAQFKFDLASNLPLIQLNRDEIRQVFLNLCLNAVEAMPSGGTLHVRTAYFPKRQEILVSIKDTGSGISEEILPYIFDPFFTAKETGTGLGLAISYEIIQRHQGRIEVESQVDQGSTFKIWLPADPKIPLSIRD